MPSLKNIIIFLVIGALIVGGYIYLFPQNEEQDPLLTTPAAIPTDPNIPSSSADQSFLMLLLGVRNVRLDDVIFSDPAFLSLRDSSITLIQDGNEGRPNPFAPIGIDIETTPEPPPASSGFPATDADDSGTVAP